jgi:ribosomal protein S18 acetylase RimI-like enzyme
MMVGQAGVVVRRATAEDTRRLGELAAELVRLHHSYDPERFFCWEPLEPGYGRFLAEQMAARAAVVLVAELEGEVVGYAYGRDEPRDWNALLDRCGVVHDVFVDPRRRRRGIATALLEEMLVALEGMGVPRVVLSTASKNSEAQALFERLGFRHTMVEMTRESRGTPQR